jgi:signal peptidase I
MEPEAIPTDSPATTIFDREERASAAESTDCAPAACEHRMTPEDAQSVLQRTEETAVPRPSGPVARHYAFPLGEPQAHDSGESLRKLVRRRRSVRRALRTLVICMGAYLLVFNLSVVRGSSMAPGIHDGDRILVGQWIYLLSDVERGDVVVMRYPVDPRLDYIKRVIGLPGDEIRMSGGAVWVNDVRLDEPYVDELDADVHFYTKVRDEHFFVLGDNRLHSSDSREFGQVHRNLLKGRVDVRIWPPSRVGWIR